MALAAVHSLKGKAAAEQAGGPLAMAAEPLSLRERVAEAQRAVVEPARRVAELEAARADAKDREDWGVLPGIDAGLARAREEHAVAEGTARGLALALAELDRKVAEEREAARRRELHEDARRRYAAAAEAERGLADELDLAIGSVQAGLVAVKRTYAEALALQTQIFRARSEMMRARVDLGEAEPGSVPAAPNKASVLADVNPVIRELVRWAP